ncbi:MAG: hypothetical protein AB8B69_21930 [Chitinophagales bacterium]
MNLKPKISLIPVIELAPSDFSKIDRTSPSKSHSESPEEWFEYNQKCYVDAGLTDIKPISQASWLVKLEDLSDDNLKIVLKQLYDSTVEGFDSIEEIINEPDEYAPFISGGYLFVVDGVIKSEPGCCSGLETIRDWEDALEYETKTEVWTGHDKEGIVHMEAEYSQMCG